MNNPAFGPKEFLTELCRYYLEFLQSDFRDKRLPARRVFFRNKDGLLTDISLAPYPDLNRTTLDLLAENFRRNPFAKIDRHTFASTLPEEPTGITKGNGSFYGALYEMWKNKQLLDRQDFYLSFLDITHNNVTYPIFYLPIGVELTAGSFSFELDPVLLVNSKAIEYVSQEFAEATKKEWKIDLPPRHIYLSNFEQNGELLGYLRNIMTEITSFFGVEELDLSQYAEVSNRHVSISTRCYLSLCDKSDESVINDYEELLTLVQAGCDTRALDIFSKLSSDYLFENPESFERQIEEDFDSLPVSERLVYESPIPLNREQIQILKAIDTKGCDRIIVEGPPGTGKSHTIAAIIYGALLKRHSVLMVSDQVNALNVVEQMINGVLEKAKLDDSIQNPIVRLGRKENTFAAIIKEVNYVRIKARYNALKKQRHEVEEDIERTRTKMVKAVDEEVEISSALDNESLAHLITYEQTFREVYGDLLDMEELESVEGSPELLYDFCAAIIRAEKEAKAMKDAYGLDLLADNSSLEELRAVVSPLYRDMLTLRQTIHDGNPCLLLGEEMTDEKLQVLERCLKSLALLDKPITGYLFSGRGLRRLDDEFKKHFVLSDICLKRDRERLSKELQIYRQCQRLNVLWSDLKLDAFFLIREEYRCGDLADRLESLLQSIDVIRDAGLKLPLTCLRIGTGKNPLPERLTGLEKEDLLKMKQYLTAYLSIMRVSRKSEEDTFVEDGRRLRKGIVARMAALLDESVVTFRETSKNDAEELRKLIRAKKQIPRGYLQKLIAAFPCLIVGIRELGEFIPLEPDIFDIAIIDEASQVSIAQAFPVILRARKIIVLGDPKQFSNVKSHNASVSINNYLFNRVKTAFDKSIAVLATPQS